jgi:hypothetical protein
MGHTPRTRVLTAIYTVGDPHDSRVTHEQVRAERGQLKQD